jgi:hypothetical protein
VFSESSRGVVLGVAAGLPAVLVCPMTGLSMSSFSLPRFYVLLRVSFEGRYLANAAGFDRVLAKR